MPFLYEMAVSFFDMAKENLEQVLQVIDGYRELEIDPEGRPKAPNHVIDEIRNLPPGDMIAYVGGPVCRLRLILVWPMCRHFGYWDF